ncbi:hypothetical protein HJFPF1_12637 [Paramyrothecium foliicola]|nr:hypothetical protein HJFPF1_12637 [Paramyrothecium foliicola]
MSGGWNPVTGRDSAGSRPSFAPYGTPLPGPGQAYIPHFGGPGHNQGPEAQYYPFSNITYGTAFIGPPGAPVGAYAAMPTPYGIMPGQVPGNYAPQPPAVSYQPNGAGNLLPRQPQQAWPSIDPAMPAAQMTNSTGGLGCEPGYNYFFPAEHTKLHVFRSEVAPWRLPPQTQITFSAVHVPCNTTCAELLRGFGCTNPVPKKNHCFEIMSGGSGKWYRGIDICGADKDMMKTTIKDVGWDQTRSGQPDGKPVVCVWFCKN